MATQVRGRQAKQPEPKKPARSAAPERTSPVVFVREIRSELRKVIWPTRNVLVTYTVVVVVFVVFMATIVTLLDLGFTKLMFALFG